MSALEPARHDVSGIVLAGGRATRFGADKLAARIQGRALVEFPIEALAVLCVEVIVAIGPTDSEPPRTGFGVPVRIARDPSPDGGPVVGLAAALAIATSPVAIVVGGDMPGLVADVARLLVRQVEAGANAAGLTESGAIRPLPCALRRDIALASAGSMAPGARLRDVLARLGAVGIAEAEWRALDPDGRSLLDVDTPADLARLPPDLG